MSTAWLAESGSLPAQEVSSASLPPLAPAPRLWVKTCASRQELGSVVADAVAQRHFLPDSAVKDSAPLNHMLDLLSSGDNPCRSVLIQHPVHERDFASEYSTFYSKTFRTYSRHCIRIHYFAASPEEGESALQFLDRMANAKRVYLGFTTLRPVKRACVGRSVISAPAGFFMKVMQQVTTKVAGARLEVYGAPFIQQDSAVGMCVQASIWMALNVTNLQHRKEAVTLGDISRAATEHTIEGRVLPARDGLTAKHVFHALYRNGYHGISIDCRSESATFNRAGQAPDNADEREVRRLEYVKAAIYPYLESGVPVILVVEPATGDHHAVVLVGHDWKASTASTSVVATQVDVPLPNASGSTRIFFTWPSTYIGRFIINNDNAGPYQELHDAQGRYCLEKVTIAYPVLHQSVYMTAEEAVTAAQRFLAQKLVAIALNRGMLNQVRDRFVLRPYLQRRHDFRRWAMHDTVGELQRHYRSVFLPSHVWVVEMHETTVYGRVGEGDPPPSRLGELVIDATGDPEDLPVLLWRYSAQVFGDRGDMLMVLSHIDEQSPAVHLVSDGPTKLNECVAH